MAPWFAAFWESTLAQKSSSWLKTFGSLSSWWLRRQKCNNCLITFSSARVLIINCTIAFPSSKQPPSAISCHWLNTTFSPRVCIGWARGGWLMLTILEINAWVFVVSADKVTIVTCHEVGLIEYRVFKDFLTFGNFLISFQQKRPTYACKSKSWSKILLLDFSRLNNIVVDFLAVTHKVSWSEVPKLSKKEYSTFKSLCWLNSFSKNCCAMITSHSEPFLSATCSGPNLSTEVAKNPVLDRSFVHCENPIL